MRLKVKKYEPSPLDYHRCEDSNGKIHRVDLMVSGTLTEYEDNPKLLEGLIVETPELTPYLVIAYEPEVVEVEA